MTTTEATQLTARLIKMRRAAEDSVAGLSVQAAVLSKQGCVTAAEKTETTISTLRDLGKALDAAIDYLFQPAPRPGEHDNGVPVHLAKAAHEARRHFEETLQ